MTVSDDVDGEIGNSAGAASCHPTFPNPGGGAAEALIAAAHYSAFTPTEAATRSSHPRIVAGWGASASGSDGSGTGTAVADSPSDSAIAGGAQAGWLPGTGPTSTGTVALWQSLSCQEQSQCQWAVPGPESEWKCT